MVQYRAFTDGFDLYPGMNTAGYGLGTSWPIGSTANMSLAPGRFGGQCVSRTINLAGVTYLARVIPYTTQAVAGVAYHVRGSYESAVRILQFRASNGSAQISLRMSATGTLYVQRGSTTIAETALPVMSTNSWHYLEMAVTISDTAGTVQVWLNDFEVPELSLSNISTKGAAIDGISQFAMGMGADRGGYLDDCYCEVDGIERMGEGRIFTLVPNGNVTADFIPSTAIDNYQSVNQVPASATLYNSSKVVGESDSFTITGMDFDPAKIYGIQISALASKGDAAARAIRQTLKSGTTTEEGSDFVLTFQSNIFTQEYFPVDPDTLATWTRGGVESVEIGYKVSI